MRRLSTSVRGLQLSYCRWGQGSETLLCLHGFQDHAASFNRVATALADRFTVIAPDFRGHGHSGWVGDGGYYHFYDYFHDVRLLLDHLELSSTHVLAHSMGGSVGSGFAGIWPDRVKRLVLLEGLGPPFNTIDDLAARVARWSQACLRETITGDIAARRIARPKMDSLEAAADRLCRVNPRLTADHALALATSFTEANGDGVSWRFDPLHRTPASKPYLQVEAEAFWRQITAPTLCLWGEHGFHPGQVDERLAVLPSVVSRWVRGGGHNLHHEQPELIASTVAKFLDEEELPSELSSIAL